MKKKLVPVVKQEPEKEVPVEVLAKSIKAISDGMRKLRQGPLKDKTLYLLIQHASPHVGGRGGYSQIPITTIKAVIEGIENLEKAYVK